MVVVACRIIVSAPVSVPFLWTMNLGLTWIWDLNLVLGFGTGLGLYNCQMTRQLFRRNSVFLDRGAEAICGPIKFVVHEILIARQMISKNFAYLSQ